MAALAAFSLIPLSEATRLSIALHGLELRWIELLRLHVVGVFFGSISPGQIGGDVYRVLSLRTSDGGLINAVAVIFTLRAIGLLVTLATAIGTLALGLVRPPYELPQIAGNAAASPSVWGWLIGLLVASAAVLWLTVRFRRGAGARRLKALASRVASALTCLSGSQLFAMLVLSFALVLERAIILSLLVSAVGEAISFSGAVLVASALTLIAVAPFLFAGLGVREGSTVALLSVLGVDYERAFLVALLGRTLLVALALWGGLWLVLGSRRAKATPAESSP